MTYNSTEVVGNVIYITINKYSCDFVMAWSMWSIMMYWCVQLCFYSLLKVGIIAVLKYKKNKNQDKHTK